MAKKIKVVETIGARVIRLREAAGINRIDLAVAAGVSQGAIQLLEKGVTRRPSAAMVAKLAEALNTSAEELAGEELTSGAPAPKR